MNLRNRALNLGKLSKDQNLEKSNKIIYLINFDENRLCYQFLARSIWWRFLFFFREALGDIVYTNDPEKADVVITTVYGRINSNPEKTICIICENMRPRFIAYKYSLSFDYDTYGVITFAYPFGGHVLHGLDLHWKSGLKINLIMVTRSWWISTV